MFLWGLMRRMVKMLRSALTPRRLFHRLAIALTLLLLLVELQPTGSPVKEAAHVGYRVGADMVARAVGSVWRPRLQVAAAQGELAAELDRLYWMEAELSVMLDAQLARAAQLEAQIATYQGQPAEVAAAQADLEHVRLLIGHYSDNAQRVQALRLQAETGQQRLDDYLALLTSDKDMLDGQELRVVDALAEEFERRRRILFERDQIDASLNASPAE